VTVGVVYFYSLGDCRFLYLLYSVYNALDAVVSLSLSTTRKEEDKPRDLSNIKSQNVSIYETLIYARYFYLYIGLV